MCNKIQSSAECVQPRTEENGKNSRRNTIYVLCVSIFLIVFCFFFFLVSFAGRSDHLNGQSSPFSQKKKNRSHWPTVACDSYVSNKFYNFIIYNRIRTSFHEFEMSTSAVGSDFERRKSAVSRRNECWTIVFHHLTFTCTYLVLCFLVP